MVEFPPVTPLTSQVTFEFVVPEIVEVNCCSPASPRATTEGEIVIVTLGRVELVPPQPMRKVTINRQQSAKSVPRRWTSCEPPKPEFALSLRNLAGSPNWLHFLWWRAPNADLKQKLAARNGTGPKGFGVSLGGRSVRTASFCLPPCKINGRSISTRRTPLAQLQFMVIAVKKGKDLY